MPFWALASPPFRFPSSSLICCCSSALCLWLGAGTVKNPPVSIDAMRLPLNVYEEYKQRRNGIIRALTADVEKLYAQCDPERDNLCLYGLPDGTWAVDLPAEEVPPEIPEPALGINFARDGMTRKDWLALVAVHSDSWLLSLAFYKGARLNREQRADLFRMINDLPTCYEVVSGKVALDGAPQARKPSGGATKGQQKRQRPADEYDDDDSDDEWRDGEGDPCPGCKGLYKTDDFWIACDKCDIWWCGKCAKMTAAKAQKNPIWKCPKCSVP